MVSVEHSLDKKNPGIMAHDSSVHDVEEGTNEPEQLKRTMGARHINMIAIAGMIVSKDASLRENP